MTSLSAPVPPVPVDVPPGSVAWLRATVARFSNGPDHVRRRALAVALLEPIGDLREKAFSRTERIVAPLDDFDVMALIARPVPVGVLASALGLPDVSADVALVAAAYHPHVTPDAAAEAALGRLIAACGGADEGVAARIGLLVQACDATAGLIGNELSARLSGKPAGQPVLSTRRRIDGADVAVSLAGTPFGAGPRACPGSRHATALATGVLQALQGFCLTETKTTWVSSPNLRMPAELWVTRGRPGTGLC
ncbi:cytochrome P450 [Amycolatopsis lexingtonensis]|uniref:Cytochrome P450 n=1 Tax=Amycolatopsis lexingtonensis TaxID=218822 RepID=A0ABR9IC04_9PSEU|nr:cytochrome P450 [Amycolatopsis lexingtonensis]MBE1500715.1 cytochrome P450 [Amycolatopsis lexingtonensis]